MKKLIIILLILIPGGCAHGPTITDVLKFSAGAVTASIIHECAHYGVAAAQGKHPKFGFLKVSLPPGERSTAVSMAGLTANALTNEIIINARPDVRRRDPFWTGLLWAGMFEEFTYPVFRGDRGDFSRDFSGQQYWKIGFTSHSLSVIIREIKNLFSGERKE